MVARVKLRAIEQHLRVIDRDGVIGDIIECGVAAGGSGALLGLWLPRAIHPRRLHLFDTFEGLPAPTTDDPDYEKAVQWIGGCRGTLEDVTAMLLRVGVDLSAVTCVKGLFQDTIPQRLPARIAFAHLDGDWYDSTRHALTAVWPRLSLGGRVQLDDYGAWEGCRKAVDEFVSVMGVRLHLIPMGGAWFARVVSTGPDR